MKIVKKFWQTLYFPVVTLIKITQKAAFKGWSPILCVFWVNSVCVLGSLNTTCVCVKLTLDVGFNQYMYVCWVNSVCALGSLNTSCVCVLSSSPFVLSSINACMYVSIDLSQCVTSSPNLSVCGKFKQYVCVC